MRCFAPVLLVLSATLYGAIGLRVGSGQFLNIRQDPKVAARFDKWMSENGWKSVSTQKKLMDKDSWPVMPAHQDGWDLGLDNPQVYVISLENQAGRRKAFKRNFDALGLKTGAEFVPAIDGNTVPVDLKWLNGFEDKSAWDHDKPGTFGCYMSHLQVLKDSNARCPTCDIVMLEDDIAFAPDFKERFTKFHKAAPKDWSMLYLGSNALWEPAFEATSEYIRGKAVSNTWGYIVRAETVPKLVSKLEKFPVKGNWGIDAVFQLWTQEFKSYLPPVPVVHAVGNCHDSDRELGHCVDDEASTYKRSQQILKTWPGGYHRTYCTAPGKLLSDQGIGGSRTSYGVGCTGEDKTVMSCCPYKTVPVIDLMEAHW